jgi:hypothetical protein
VKHASYSQLAQLERELEQVTAGARRLAERLDDVAFARRPGPERWSPTECLLHLCITTDAYLPLLRAALAEAAALPPTDRPYRRDLSGWLLSRSLEPGSYKLKTPHRFEPITLRPRMQVIAEFESKQAALIALLREGMGLDLTAVRVQSPFSAKMRYNVYSAFKVLTAHERRHLAQAEAAAAGK